MVKEFIALIFLPNHFPPCMALFFFQTTKNKKVLYIPLLDIFQHQGSGNSFRGAKGSPIGPVLFKFCPSVGDGAT
jgi:hypothetical protein